MHQVIACAAVSVRVKFFASAAELPMHRRIQYSDDGTKYERSAQASG